MQYFDTLPKILYVDQYGIASIRTNLLARASVVAKAYQDPLLYYQYDTQDGDTPEIVAHKYYNDMYRYWIVLLFNQMLDPQWSWPMSGNQFNAFMSDKYGNLDVNGTVHHYEKTVTQFDVNTQTTTTNTVEIPETVYASFVNSSNTVMLPTGQVNITITASAVSIYEYEFQLNESKRTIYLLNNQYVDSMEQQFINLMSK
jgi:hypothetical protein